MLTTLSAEDMLFHAFALVAVISAFLVIFVSSPVYSALFLALTMSVLGALFFMLQGYFVAVAQITVYAGAVMVLFVMVLMLFDLRKEHDEFLKPSPLSLAKLAAVIVVGGFLVGTAWVAVGASSGHEPAKVTQAATTSVAPGAAATAQTQPVQGVQGQVNPDDDLTNAEEKALVEQETKQETKNVLPEYGSTITLSERLFSRYVFAFEAVSVLLLVAIVGAVALARSKGGTHHVAR